MSLVSNLAGRTVSGDTHEAASGEPAGSRAISRDIRLLIRLLCKECSLSAGSSIRRLAIAVSGRINLRMFCRMLLANTRPKRMPSKFGDLCTLLKERLSFRNSLGSNEISLLECSHCRRLYFRLFTGGSLPKSLWCRRLVW